MRQFHLLRFQQGLTAKLNQASYQGGNGGRYKADLFFWDSGADLNLFQWVEYLCNLEYFQYQKNCLNFICRLLCFACLLCCLLCVLFLSTQYLLMSELLKLFLFWDCITFTACKSYAYSTKMCFHIVLFNIFLYPLIG